MATKKQLAEQVIRLVRGFKPTHDRAIDIREVMLAIDQARDAALVKWMYQNLNLEGEGYVAGDFINVYVDAVRFDDLRKDNYIDLRYEVFTMPHDLGVYHISFVENEEDAFTPMRNGYLNLFRNTTALHEQRVSYFVEGKRVWFYGDIEADCNVLIKMVAISSSIPEDDTYPIPSGLQFEILSQVAQLYGVRVPRDEKNDDIDP
jgi:hypothetical protein